jgi:ribosomal protein S18 acetylase RimI-like enzyme
MLEGYELHPDAFGSSVAERAALPLKWWEERLVPDPAAPGSQPASLVLGAFEEEELAGVVGLAFETREKTRHKALLFGMCVPPKFRRLGLGRRLVLAALKEAQARPGLRLVQLTVSATNHAARTLYEQCGFMEFGLEPLAMAFGGELIAKVHMWCELGDFAAADSPVNPPGSPPSD